RAQRTHHLADFLCLGIQEQSDTANEGGQMPAYLDRLRQGHQARAGLEKHQTNGIRTRRHCRLGTGYRVYTANFNTYALHNLPSLTCLALLRGQTEVLGIMYIAQTQPLRRCRYSRLAPIATGQQLADPLRRPTPITNLQQAAY